MRTRASGLFGFAATSGGVLVGALGMALMVRGCPDGQPAASARDAGGEVAFESRSRPLTSPPPVARPPVRSPSAMPTIAADPLVELRERHLELPLEGADRRELRDSFHETRRPTHRHEAIDIMAPRHTPVLAVEDGTIARLFESKAGGTTVYQFDPAATYVYYYAHLERYAEGLHEGKQVQRREVLGYVGTSGNAPEETPHLHFAIFRLTERTRWWQGTPIDPYLVWR